MSFFSRGLGPVRGGEPCVPLRRCSDRDRGIFAAADLGAVWAFHLNHSIGTCVPIPRSLTPGMIECRDDLLVNAADLSSEMVGWSTAREYLRLHTTDEYAMRTISLRGRNRD